MRYIDTGSRERDESLASWFQTVLTDEVVELRWQTGFFYAEGAGLLVPTLERLKLSKGIVRAVIGANMNATLGEDVEWLLGAIGIPRQNADLAVVSFIRGLFHPKTYHTIRADGSAAAYVGSANLTSPAVSGRNVEAGLSLDTREGDSSDVLRAIASGIDWWFAAQRDGLYRVPDLAAVEHLLHYGILAKALPPRSQLPVEAEDEETSSDTDQPSRGRRAGLQDLVQLPRVRPRVVAPALPKTVSPSARRPSVPRKGFPDYFLFDSTATVPTFGENALSGASLPSGAVGLIVRLNKDSARHFEGGGGTANISIPIATLQTLRFGSYDGKYVRPRAEFSLRARYVGDPGFVLSGDVLDTSIMAYGYADGEPGHQDIRLVVPAGVRDLVEQISAARRIMPAVNDFALLEWPLPEQPDFRLTYLEVESRLASEAAQVFEAAQAAKEMVGRRACWLPPGLAPAWD
jgi:hypothetical protein